MWCTVALSPPPQSISDPLEPLGGLQICAEIKQYVDLKKKTAVKSELKNANN